MYLSLGENYIVLKNDIIMIVDKNTMTSVDLEDLYDSCDCTHINPRTQSLVLIRNEDRNLLVGSNFKIETIRRNL